MRKYGVKRGLSTITSKYIKSKVTIIIGKDIPSAHTFINVKILDEKW